MDSHANSVVSSEFLLEEGWSRVVGELVILGRPLHTQPLIPRYLYTVIGS